MEKKSSTTRFSVIIICLDEKLFLPYLLEDLSHQSNKNFEIIIVDAGSTDGTQDEIRKFTKQLSITLIVSEKKNPSFQRNTGAKQATGEIVIFMDADNRIPKHFLQKISRQLEHDTSIDAFTCLISTVHCKTHYRPLIELLNIHLVVMARIKPTSPGSLIGVRREVCDIIKFDETLQVSEDHTFVNAAVRSGFNFVVLREPRYIFSFRRVDKEGTVKILVKYARFYLDFIVGKKTEISLDDYPMLGGAFYEKSDFQMMSSFEEYIRSQSRKQLNQIKKIISDLEIYP